MLPVLTLSFGFRLLAIILLFTGFHSGKSLKVINDKKGFAVIELFTSEGCSSCPSADEAIIALSKEFSENVYFLGYHVDYWNYLGWKDAFSRKEFTDRQREYGEHFNLNSIYTPQVVVNGKKEFIGSDKTQLRNTIEHELNNSANHSIELSAKTELQNIVVNYKAGAGKDEQLLIALVQRMATSQVNRGENRGHVLKHINIVRELKTADLKTSLIQFKIPEGLTSANFRVIAFIQDRYKLNINDAAEVKID